MAQAAKTPPRALIKPMVALHNVIYRVSGGRLGGHFGKGPVLLLMVKGRKSGKAQTVPLIYVATDRGYAIIASFAGSPTNPAWYLNLTAAGSADIQVGAKRLRVRPEGVQRESADYDDIWRRAVALYPDYETYKTRTTRVIPIVELVPQ
ncbi:MAG TPA: nitroreductase/quinone reductase family protein [Rhizomicrobium sp.]|nr:nitroreductase/quinone reductase family protein [Rhizomicrobium sp.]